MAQQIREAVELLTRVLLENGTQQVKAELFRCAKFNNAEGVVPLWKLLFELISYCEFGKIDEVTVRASNQLSSDELVVYVKRELVRRGYNSLHFASLPNDMSDGSRELLLAFGWMMVSEKIIDRFMISCTAPLDDDTVSLHLLEDNPSLGSSLSSAQGLPSSQVPPLNKDAASPCQRVEQLLAFNNKLRMSLRGLYSAQCERNLLKHKIQAATSRAKSSKSAMKHLSMLEVYLMRHPELLQKHIELLEQDNERLRNLLRWKDIEGIFWKWMESVLEEKRTNAQRDRRPEEDPIDAVRDSASRMCSSHCNLQQAVLKYESIIEHLGRLCEEKIEDVSSEAIENILDSINKELSLQKARLVDNGFVRSVEHATEPRFILDDDRVAKMKNISRSGARTSNSEQSSADVTISNTDEEAASTVSTSAIRDIEDEIAMLRGFASSLDRDVDALRSHYDEQMRQMASSQFHDAVCIPPLNRNLVARHPD